MKSQWESFQQNLGVWEGSFTVFSPEGTFVKDIPSRLTLEKPNDSEKVRLTLCRSGLNDMVLEFTSVGGSLLFFENGAFSQGSIQLAPFTEFGAEFSFIYENRRLRLVQLFAQNGELDRLTLIREHLADTPKVERPPLQVADLLGTWQGQAITIYPDWRLPDLYSTTLQLQIDQTGQLIQSLNFGERTITSTATIKGSIIHFNKDSQKQVQVLLLPDGASATSPLQVQPRQPLFLEAGWLIQPNLRQRMVRSYNDKGEWTSLTLVTEEKTQP
ncbi:DUF3598 family protein [Nostocaceae cyanobacterium CENA369]|uniref:DUF3598 family protein n=1 Tax=Dendronalium phyllosphericum CENA369 TaxID=1725256 RepID=A0A8J7I422_9NOST|nr:DUF3598 family protein [Dendronalium phyllosphericum]MBH8573125.1 DUF3598 family protein [Dendronalium phyllosphericum CENA369]